jgi:hypothetical protein
MTSFTSLILTSLNEVFIERMEYDDTFHTFSHCDLIVWSIYWRDRLRWHLQHDMKSVIILHPLNNYFMQWGHNEKKCERCHRTPFPQWILHTMKSQWEKVWKVSYWGEGVRWHLSYLFSLWPQCIKYLLRGWSTMTPFIPFLIVTSLYEVFIEGIGYDDNTSVSEITMRKCMKGVIVLLPLNKYFIQWGHKQRCERCHCTPSTQ